MLQNGIYADAGFDLMVSFKLRCFKLNPQGQDITLWAKQIVNCLMKELSITTKK